MRQRGGLRELEVHEARAVQEDTQAGRRWHIERTHAWQNDFRQLARCYERRMTVIDAFFDLADTIVAIRSLNNRPNRHS
ncbi:hypothetical protein [Streptomyces shenzhenensis]|uniref:hypothetical protein n=1 Tax=Streptomyces shenzhenensis TaxID=943815 RepID=UPI003F541A73